MIPTTSSQTAIWVHESTTFRYISKSSFEDKASNPIDLSLQKHRSGILSRATFGPLHDGPDTSSATPPSSRSGPFCGSYAHEKGGLIVRWWQFCASSKASLEIVSNGMGQSPVLGVHYQGLPKPGLENSNVQRRRRRRRRRQRRRRRRSRRGRRRRRRMRRRRRSRRRIGRGGGKARALNGPHPLTKDSIRTSSKKVCRGRIARQQKRR